jgi:hypothetical protein
MSTKSASILASTPAPHQSSYGIDYHRASTGASQPNKTLIFGYTLSRITIKMSTSTGLTTFTLKHDPLTPIEGKPTPEAVRKLRQEGASLQT